MKLTEVHKDERRTINVIDGLLEENKEFSIIQLNKGMAIGGCKHNRKEYFTVVKGKVFAKIGNVEMIIPEGSGGEIERNKPHMFHAIKEDCIIVEWGITAEEKQNDEIDITMRLLVNTINENK